MSQYKTGVVCGKFYPPHAGHEYLITTAISKCERLYVLVIGTHGEQPDASLRISWLKDTFPYLPNVHFMVIPNIAGYEDDSEMWAKYAQRLLREIEIDAVFSSEDYGDTWAEALGCAHEKVDHSRVVVPISGTMCREDPFQNWAMLNDHAKQYYARRVCLVGGESTGKTTLAKRLANRYNTTYVPEYGRAYVEDFGLDEKDPLIWPLILTYQPIVEDYYAEKSNGLVICDTDLMTTAIWYQRWVGNSEKDAVINDPMYQAIYAASLTRKYDRYLFCDDEGSEWVQDGTRSEGENRKWFSSKIVGELNKRDIDFCHIDGTWEERFDAAVFYIDEIWNKE